MLDDGALDRDRFESLAAAGQDARGAGRHERAAALLEEALALWHGPAFGDLAGRAGAG